MANDTCKMKTEVLETRKSGPFEIEIIGSPILCLEAEGDANLGPFTATARITNRSSKETPVSYQRGVSSAFQSVSFWRAGRRDQAAAFNECCGDAQSGRIEQKILASGEALLISSWTRHHNEIWSDMRPSLGTNSLTAPQDYVVRFSLNIAYNTEPVTLTESFDITFGAIPK